MSDLHNDARIPLNSETVHNLLLAAEDVMSRYSVPEEYALQRLMESLEGRESNALNIPCGVPMVQASARYFVLLETATEHLKGRFSSAEFDLLLNPVHTGLDLGAFLLAGRHGGGRARNRGVGRTGRWQSITRLFGAVADAVAAGKRRLGGCV